MNLEGQKCQKAKYGRIRKGGGYRRHTLVSVKLNKQSLFALTYSHAIKVLELKCFNLSKEIIKLSALIHTSRGKVQNGDGIFVQLDSI